MDINDKNMAAEDNTSKDKKTIKEKVKEFGAKTKQFFIDHKKPILTGIGVGFGILCAAGARALEISNSDDEYDEYRTKNLRNKTYDELQEMRSYVHANTQGEQRDELLGTIDEELQYRVNPREKHARSLSDEELNDELERARTILYDGQEKYCRHNKRIYAEMIQDPEFRKFERDSDNFTQLNNEKNRRYAEQNPDHFPVPREHGWNLYKAD